jgi:hypothetical protein
VESLPSCSAATGSHGVLYAAADLNAAYAVAAESIGDEKAADDPDDDAPADEFPVDADRTAESWHAVDSSDCALAYADADVFADVVAVDDVVAVVVGDGDAAAAAAAATAEAAAGDAGDDATAADDAAWSEVSSAAEIDCCAMDCCDGMPQLLQHAEQQT